MLIVIYVYNLGFCLQLDVLCTKISFYFCKIIVVYYTFIFFEENTIEISRTAMKFVISLFFAIEILNLKIMSRWTKSETFGLRLLSEC